jgi:hypothetical protein
MMMKIQNSYRRILIWISAVTLLSGCFFSERDDRPARVKVSGVVTYQNAPLEAATVVFHPDDHSNAAVGITDEKGRFQLRTFEMNDGAVPGTFTVSIRKDDGTGVKQVSNGDGTVTEYEPRLLVPEKYADSKTSGLSVTVVAKEKNEFQFDLSGELPPAPKGRRVREEIE